jgi:hypothetical protein
MTSCSGSGGERDAEPASGIENAGEVSLPLTAQVNGAVFRLVNAQFTINGAALGKKPRIVKPLPDVPVHTETLPAGGYSILLEDGWVLERKGTGQGATFQPVQAKLITSNPVVVEVASQSTTDAWFNFVTAAGDVSLGRGNVDIRIGVQDCSSYDGVTAALATLTVDCLGTISPGAFKVNADGIVSRAFNSCPLDETKLRSIDGLLSLQYRTARLPFVRECLGERFASFQNKFAESGIEQCPQWKKIRTVNPITADVIEKVIPSLPELPAEDPGEPLSVLSTLKENNLYSVFFETTPPQQACDTPGECAAACSAGFPSFVIRADTEVVLTDPPAWLLDTTYASSTADPYLRPGYYHPMSYYGAVPGVQFGDAARAAPCGFGVNAAVCPAEQCSYFSGVVHLKYPLKLDCLDDTDFSTCVSFCSP